MLALAIVLGYAAACAVVFALVVLAALPFRLMRRTRDPLIASALGCGTPFVLAMCVNGVPEHLERALGFYAVAFLVSFRFYGWRDARKARSARDVGAAVGLAGTLPGGATNGSREADDLSPAPEVQI